MDRIGVEASGNLPWIHWFDETGRLGAEFSLPTVPHGVIRPGQVRLVLLYPDTDLTE